MSQDQTHTNDNQIDDALAARQEWMALLARAEMEELETAFSGFEGQNGYHYIREPEIGMVMVRGRAGGEGQRFNMGEMTVTRCVVVTASGEQGHSYIAGRNKRHATLAAFFDAMMQDPNHSDAVRTSLLASIKDRIEQASQTHQGKTAATRVDFFTMVRGS